MGVTLFIGVLFMLNRALTTAAVLSFVAAATLLGGPIDPQGPDFPDIGVDSLYLSAPGGICFTDGDYYCLEDLAITANGPDSDTYSPGNEIDTFPGVLSGDLINESLNFNDGNWAMPYDGSQTALELIDRTSGEDGSFFDQFTQFDFKGTLPDFGSAEIEESSSEFPTFGVTTVTGPDANGNYSLTSYFDIFIEISINGSTPVQQSGTDATEFDLVAPEPGTFFFLVPGAILLALYRLRYRAAWARAISRQS